MSYGLVLAFPVLLWIMSNPGAGVVILAAISGLVLLVREGLRLVRCFYDRGEFSFNLGGKIQITITQPSRINQES